MPLKPDRSRQTVVYIVEIKGAAIKKFVMLDILLGTGIFYAVKLICSSVLVASVGSFLGTEGIKRAPRMIHMCNRLIFKMVK